MEFSIVTVSRVFKTYQGQARIAELNSKNPVRRTQGQRDRVSISSEAKAAHSKHAMQHLLAQLRPSKTVEADKAPLENLDTQTIQTEKVEAEKDKVTPSSALSE